MTEQPPSEGDIHRVFQDKVALVTGASRGIGRAIALALARRGARVILHYGQRKRHARGAVEAFRTAGLPEPMLIQADLRSPEAIAGMFDQLGEARLDILVANAASAIFKKAMELSIEDWDHTLNASARSLLLLVQQARSRLGRGSSIVAVSSEGPRQMVDTYAALAAAKGALEGLVRSLARELGPHGIRVNAVSTLVVDTLSLRQLPGSDSMLRQAEQQTPLGRVTLPEDVADGVCLLCMPEAAWITGQLLLVDGGVCSNLLDQ